jgi:nucleoside-diphosphate-sugar epimerase
MKVFVTGASGHIGSALIPELLHHGHEVVGLARSDSSAAQVAERGAEVRRGDLYDPEGLAAAARESDAVIHLAFDHESMFGGDREKAVGADLTVLNAFGDALAGTDKPLVGTGGSLMLAFMGITDRPGTEEDRGPGGPRIDAENYVIGLKDRGVRSGWVRLAPMVHSELDTSGFTPTLIGAARAAGAAAYVGDGSNRWPAANTYDIATLYRLAIEKGPAGQIYHGVEGPSMPRTLIAETIAEGLGIEAKSISQAEAGQYLSFLGDFASLDNPVSNDATREILGWEPTHPGWVEDVRSGHYFAAVTA